MLHALRQEGLAYSEISRRIGCERRSVTKWLKFNAPPDRLRAALNPTSPWYFEDFLAQCWKDGSRRGRHLFHDIKQRGYTGSFANLERQLRAWRRAGREPADDVPPPTLKSKLVRDPETGHAISPAVAAALCIMPRGSLTDEQANKVDALKQGSDTFAEMRRLAMRFNGILRGRRSAPVDAWIDDAIDSELIPIMRFAGVLRQRHQRHQAALEQRADRRPDQPPKDPQARNVWSGRSRTAEGTNAPIAPHRVRKNPINWKTTQPAKTPAVGGAAQASYASGVF